MKIAGFPALVLFLVIGVCAPRTTAQDTTIFPPTVPTVDQISQELNAAKAQNHQAQDDAKKALVDEINKRLNAAADAGNLPLVKSLQKAQGTAAVDATIPDDVKDAPVLTAKREYDTAIKNAKTKLVEAYRKAVHDYTRARQIARADATQTELDNLGLIDPNAPSSMTSGTYQLTNNLPDFLTAKDAEFVGLGDRMGIIVPETNYIRTKESDLLSKNFTFDVSFYLLKGMPAYAKLPAAVVGLGEGTANIASGSPQDSLYLEINPPDRSHGDINLHRRNDSSKTKIGTLKDFDTYVARIQKSGGTVTFTVGTMQSGTLVPVASETVDDVRNDSPYLNDQNGHLFFGAGAFTQLSIGKGPAPAAPTTGAAADQVAGSASAAGSGQAVRTVGDHRTIDLLKITNAKRDALAGRWHIEDGSLSNEAERCTQIRFPYSPPGEYDLHVVYDRDSADYGIIINLCRGERSFYCGLPDLKDCVNSVNVQLRHELRSPAPGEAARHCDVCIQVRSKHLTIIINGQKTIDQVIDFWDFGDPPDWLANGHFGLGVTDFYGRTTITKAEVTEISGTGRITTKDSQ